MAMDQNSIVLRAANPTFDEGLLCGHYLDEVAEGFFRLMLGRRYAEIIAEAYPRPNHSYSFENVVYAEYDKHIIGMVLGFTGEQQDGFSNKPIKEAAGLQVLRMRVVNTLFAPMMRILKTVPDSDFYILSMAVDGEFRGRGIGSILIENAEKRARESGLTRISLDVSAKNKGAIRLYERCGMTIESQWPRQIPIPGMKFYRMAKSL